MPGGGIRDARRALGWAPRTISRTLAIDPTRRLDRQRTTRSMRGAKQATTRLSTQRR